MENVPAFCLRRLPLGNSGPFSRSIRRHIGREIALMAKDPSTASQSYPRHEFMSHDGLQWIVVV